ncbi:chorismate mutase [Longibacter sp.]|jgi:chorismate mutase|uniref:chorismate mutase n=1 Tax=Longibacter sp. TaxID=2045415 RepID=UPI003EBD357C
MSSSASTLSDIRSRIDQLDQAIIELLARRQSAVDDIAAVKEEKNDDIRDPDRECELMDRLRDIARDNDLAPGLVEDLYASIIEHSVERQKNRRTSSRSSHLRKVG